MQVAADAAPEIRIGNRALGPGHGVYLIAELSANHLRPAVSAVPFREEPGQAPVLAGREWRGARRDHLNALRRFPAERTHAVRQARSEMNAVAASELFVLDAAGRLDRELDRALQHERELVLVVVAEAIGARGEPSK